MSNLLKGKPVKRGFKIAATPPAPVSMFSAMPWTGPAAAANSSGGGAGSLSSSSGVAADSRTRWVGQRDFDAVGNKQRSAVAKPGFSDATTAGLHDTPDV